MIEIKHRYNGTVILTVDADSLIGANLSYANLIGANLRGANLRGANLIGADLSSASLRDADLSSANLRDADLSSANLRDADLSSASLRYANLSSANLIGANLRDANLSGANLRDADLFNAIGNGKEIKSLHATIYNIAWTEDRLQIGCKNYSKQEWLDLSDNEIDGMDGKAVEWWKEWKPKLIALGVL